MSAIAGLVRFSGEPVIDCHLSEASDLLAAPGLGAPAAWRSGGAGFLVRQRIVTPEDMAERQPWIGRDGRRVLVYDGRMDNRDEVMAALGISPRPEEAIPDGLLFLEAFERWKEDAPRRLIGDFVVALWDDEERRLLLVRDQMGMRTLYYHRGSDFVAFATTFRALQALPGVPRRLDELGIADFLILNGNHPEETFYQGLRRVPGATVMAFDARGQRANRYWAPDPEHTLRLAGDGEYVEAARELLDRAVSCRLRAAAPVAAEMSGGLDSSAVASTAARLLAPERLPVVTTVPPPGLELPAARNGAYNDETPYVTAVAAMHPNMDLTLVSSRGRHRLETDPTLFFDAAAFPAAMITNIGWFAPSEERIADAGITVLLCGSQGNSAWSWDGLRDLENLFRRGRWLTLFRELVLAGRRRPWGRDWRMLLRTEVINPMIPAVWARYMSDRRGRGSDFWSGYSAINPNFAREIRLFERCLRAGHAPCLGCAASGRALRLLMLNRMGHGRDIGNAMRAITGIERRDPLADIRLIEFCLSLPHDQYLRDGITRRLARRCLTDRLPSMITARQELLGKQNPEWFHRMNSDRAGMVESFSRIKSSLPARRILDLPRLEALLRDWPADAVSAERRSTLYHYVLPRALHLGQFLLWAERKSIDSIPLYSYTR